MTRTGKASETSDREPKAGSVSGFEPRDERRPYARGLLAEASKRFSAWLHLLSLDAPLVAVLWQLLFAKTMRVDLPPVVTLILASVIWLIYVADRILDSYQPENLLGEAVRHRFYRRHRMAFLPAFVAVLLVTSWMAYAHLGLRMQREGLLLAATVGGYFAVVHLLSPRARRWFPKEMVVAIVFGAGTLMPVSVRADLHFRFLLPFALFLMVLWMNTLFIEYSEWVVLRGCDADRPHRSTVLVGQHFDAFGAVVGILALCAMASRWFPMSRPILFTEALSALGLGILGWQWKRISAYAVRVTADIVLLTPLFVLFRK